MQAELLHDHAVRQEQLLSFYTGHYNQVISLLADQKKALIDYKHRAHYWQAQFKQLKDRESEKDLEIAALKAKLKKREHQLFGKKSEKDLAKSESLKQGEKNEQRKRGQQKNNQGPKRRDYSDLPLITEEIDLLEKDKCCPDCQCPYGELPQTEDSTIIEVINVRAYQRKIHRKMYKARCQCPNRPKIITAPIPNKLLPKSRFGISVWAYLLIQKYAYQRPQHSTLKALSNNGLSIAVGTITEGYQMLMQRYLAPLYNLIQARSLSAQHWHADETGWKVFEALEGKANNRWFLWIFRNRETVLFKIAPSRSSQVLLEHFSEGSKGILNVDRYRAYRVIAKSGLFILAYCWAHVRRDFLDHAREHPHQEAWALDWVKRIGQLYSINNQRVKQPPHSKTFKKLAAQLNQAIANFKQQVDQDEKDVNLPMGARKLMTSLNNHWHGLTVFIDHPSIPMDNNIAENGLRSPVVGRKGYYGSGAIWSSELAAILFSLFGTLTTWKINPHTWLLAYLHECAMYGKAPPTIESYLPWNMTEEQRNQFAKPPAYEDSP